MRSCAFWVDNSSISSLVDGRGLVRPRAWMSAPRFEPLLRRRDAVGTVAACERRLIRESG